MIPNVERVFAVCDAPTGITNNIKHIHYMKPTKNLATLHHLTWTLITFHILIKTNKLAYQFQTLNANKYFGLPYTFT